MGSICTTSPSKTYAPTAIPMLDAELGFHPDNPRRTGPPSTGWDGEHGPFIQGSVVSFASFVRSDYVLHAFEDKTFSGAGLADLDRTELIARMDALRLCIQWLPESSPQVDHTKLGWFMLKSCRPLRLSSAKTEAAIVTNLWSRWSNVTAFGALRQAAVRKGADLHRGVEVRGVEVKEVNDEFRLHTTTGSVVARSVVDASGRHLVLARLLGLGQHRLSPPLIAWRDNLAVPSVCTGAFARFVPGANGWIWLAEVETNHVVRVRLTPARGGGAKLLTGTTAHNASWHLVRRLAGPGWLIAGAAAAAMNPAFCTVVVTDLRSGLIAGAATAKGVANQARAPLIAASYHDALTREGRSGAATLAFYYHRLGSRLTSEDAHVRA